VFITFEGPEGAGKSTVIQQIQIKLEALGHAVMRTREPGAGNVGAAIREIILHGETLDPRCELFLFLADRSHHVAEIIRPSLERGDTVLCDRYVDSTVVYQGVGRGFDRSKMRELNTFATSGLLPDLTLLLDIDSEIGLARVSDRNRLDDEPLAFHQSVRQAFLDEASNARNRFVVVDASQTLETVVEQCLHAVLERFKTRTSSLS
jgi:dTMP kinase